jgi:ABC-2 type transport system permease protein
VQLAGFYSATLAGNYSGVDTLFVTLTILFAIMLLTGRSLNFSPTALAPIGSILLGSFGVAFLMGALALWFKRVQQLTNLGQFVLLFLVIVPFESWTGWARAVSFALPFVPGVGMMREVLARGQDLDWTVLGLAYANGLFYAVAGLVLFRAIVARVKRLGTLGWY